MMKELHAQGKTTEEIADCLKQIPLHPTIVSAIKTAHASGYFSKLIVLQHKVCIILYMLFQLEQNLQV